MLGIVGAVSMGASGAVLAFGATRDGGDATVTGDATATYASMGLLLGGAALAITGSSLQMAALPHFFLDAVNIYNDAQQR